MIWKRCDKSVAFTKIQDLIKFIMFFYQEVEIFQKQTSRKVLVLDRRIQSELPKANL